MPELTPQQKYDAFELKIQADMERMAGTDYPSVRAKADAVALLKKEVQDFNKTNTIKLEPAYFLIYLLQKKVITGKMTKLPEFLPLRLGEPEAIATPEPIGVIKMPLNESDIKDLQNRYDFYASTLIKLALDEKRHSGEEPLKWTNEDTQKLLEAWVQKVKAREVYYRDHPTEVDEFVQTQGKWIADETEKIARAQILEQTKLPDSASRAAPATPPPALANPVKPSIPNKLVLPLQNLYNKVFKKTPAEQDKARVKKELSSIITAIQKSDYLKRNHLAKDMVSPGINSFKKNLDKNATSLIKAGKTTSAQLLEEVLKKAYEGSGADQTELKIEVENKLKAPAAPTQTKKFR
jgi:hypothetical protein